MTNYIRFKMAAGGTSSPSSPSSPTRFLDSVFDSFKEKLNEEYSRFMDRHVEAISSELNCDEYTLHTCKSTNDLTLPPNRWIIHGEYMDDGGEIFITNYGDIIHRHAHTRYVQVPPEWNEYVLPDIIINFIKGISNDKKTRFKGLSNVAEHYYKKFTQYKPLFSSGKLIEYDVLLSENTTVKEENERFKNRIIELESEIQLLKDKYVEKETTLKTTEDKLSETMTYAQRLEAMIDKHEDEIETLKHNISQLESDCEKHLDKEENYQERIATIKVVNESLLKEKSLLSRENRVLNAEKEELEKTQKDLLKTNRELEILKNVLIEDKSKYLADLDGLKEKHKTELHELYMKNKKQIEETNNYLIQLETMRNDSRGPDGRTYRVLYEELVSTSGRAVIPGDPEMVESKPRIVLESMELKEEWWIGLQKSMSFRTGKTPIKINGKPFLGSDMLVYTTETKELVGRLVYDYSRSVLELISMP